MSTYSAILFCSCIDSPDMGGGLYIRMKKRVKLPFVPISGISLGLEPHSGFSCDETRVSRVMWHCHDQAFHLDVGEHRGHAREAVESLAGRGWEVALVERMGSFDEAKDVCVNIGDHAVVKTQEGIYTVTEDELWALRATSQMHELLWKNDGEQPEGES